MYLKHATILPQGKQPLSQDRQYQLGSLTRLGSPLVIGLGKDENFVGSDVSAIMEHTRNILYLDDDEMDCHLPNKLF